MGSRELPFYQVDAFSSEAFSGNPAAVILLDDSSYISDSQRQSIAAENNLAETAYVVPHPEYLTKEGDPFQACSHFSLRWFTPAVEVPMCGHATLASAAVLFKEKCNASPVLFFHTLSGVLEVTQQLEMSLPLCNPTDPVPQSCQNVSGPFAHACSGGLPVSEIAYAASSGLNYVLVRLVPGTSRQHLESMKPDLQAMQEAVASESAGSVRGVIVTTSGDGYDVLSRFFAPWLGVPEDHVTGSAHSALAPYWQARLPGIKDGRSMAARQCSSRGGDLMLRVDSVGNKVVVSGHAVIVIKGTMFL